VNQLKDLAKYVSDRLLDEGFIVQRYDAYSTDSIYLKLDYGTANSIRISSHPGKKHLRYRYNIILDGQTEDVMDTYIRHYYKPEDVDSMLEAIIAKKKEDIQKYGITGYQKCMQMNIKEHENDKKGFWAQAKILNQKGKQ
jgi:hypothetical protein